ncbi:MAG TPA: SDR family NAD(P)-dependent oxidoreductase [Rhodocyclaceae bacterium]|nr:SDR family NAD(P)-dependent oxidoreductase [Rhodocyclaceae bacterium]
MLDGRVALVTGAARGIGLEISRLLIANHCRVALVDVESNSLEESALALGKGAVPFVADISDAPAVEELVRQVTDLFGRIDILVNNAAINPTTQWDAIGLSEWDRVFAVNVRGPYLLMRAVVPVMRRSRWGRIISIGSIAGKQGGPNSGMHYCASKAAVMDLSRFLARRVGGDGITVNAIAPGVVDTVMTSGWPVEVKNEWIARNPIPRLAKPLDIAGAVLFLASEWAEYVTGETLDVNGGALMD